MQKHMSESFENESLSERKSDFQRLIGRGLFHCTPLRNLERILETGSIQPNLGQFPFEQPLSRISRCRKLSGVSLFDLSLDEHGGFFYVWLEKTHLAIKLDRRRVKQNLLDPVLKKSVGGLVLRAEICCLAPIPISCFAGYLLVSRRGRPRFSYLKAPTDFKTISAEARKLEKQPPNELEQ
jgi:hypothetical protein